MKHQSLPFTRSSAGSVPPMPDSQASVPAAPPSQSGTGVPPVFSPHALPLQAPRFRAIVTAHPGAIIIVRNNQPRGRSRLISPTIRWYLKSWSNHTAIAGCPDCIPAIGDADIPRARWTPLDDYCRDIQSGRIEVRCYWPADAGATPAQGRYAADWWHRHVNTRPYDIPAIWAMARMLWRGGLKCLRADAHYLGGRDWAWFCSEGVAAAWHHGASLVISGKPAHLTTPLTFEHRAADGTLKEIT